MVVCCFTQLRLEDTVTAVETALAQGAGEVLVVVDHNQHLEQVLSQRLSDHRLVIMANQGPRGLSGGRNTAIRHASGRVVLFLDDDAEPGPGWLDGLLQPYSDASVAGTGGSALPRWPPSGRPAWFPDEFLWVVGCSYRGQPLARADVRNFLGCNMSFRRDVFDRIGGFELDLGRVGSTPLGCEESEFCVRLRQRDPDARLVLDPQHHVLHRVTAERCTLRYFVRRCWSEGLSKALVTQLVGADDGLSTERGYATRVLPVAVLRGLAQAARGDRNAVRRAGAVVLGLLVTTAGYVGGSLVLARSGRGTGPGQRPTAAA